MLVLPTSTFIIYLSKSIRDTKARNVRENVIVTATFRAASLASPASTLRASVSVAFAGRGGGFYLVARYAFAYDDFYCNLAATKAVQKGNYVY